MKIKKIILSFIMLLLCQNAYSDELDKIIGQKILVGLGPKKEYKSIIKYAQKGKIGGVIFFQRDIEGGFDLLDKTRKLNSIKGIPLFISVDQEGGYVQRLSSKNGFRDYKTSKELANESVQSAYAQYKIMAQELKFYGFNMNFAPCVDLIIDENSIINKNGRSYSSDPDIVVQYSKEALRAYYESKIVTSLKHFPGHGSAKGDTHLGFVDVTDTWNEDELIPYKKLSTQNDLQTVMVSHVFNKNFDTKYPASLSKNTVGMLREYFDGVVISDDYDMGAIKNNYSLNDIVINAINADIDILLFSNFNDTVSIDEIHQIIKNAVKEGKIKKEQLEASYNRIIKLKEALYR